MTVPPIETDYLVIGAGAIGMAFVLELELPNCPTLAQAEHAAAAFPGFKSHLFPRCFVCGPAREAGDGLRIFSSPLQGQTLHAAPWVPHESLADDRGDVATEFLWAALDCPSGFAVLPVVLRKYPIPLGVAVTTGLRPIAVAH